jgi:hypothetical protein
VSLVLVFDRKRGETVDCAYLASHRHAPVVLLALELAFSLFQAPMGTDLGAFWSAIVQLLASHLNLFASRRLLMETLEILLRRQRKPGTWPLFSEWIALLDQIHVSSASRLGQYKEASLYALKGIQKELGKVLDCVSSTMLDHLLAQSGCIVILTESLSVEATSLLASLVINYAYHLRGRADPEALEPVIFVLDDALPLIRSSSFAESEGGINPISTWAFMGRSRRMGIVCAAQNYSIVSPTFRNNCDSVLCFGSYGRDAVEIARDLNLSPEQAAALTVIRPGEVVAIARSVWPLACHGRVPEVT